MGWLPRTRTAVRDEPWRPGYAVRRDWPIDGIHEFITFKVTDAEAGWAALADRVFWRRCHARPFQSVVEISLRDFELHGRRRDCRSPDCPVAAPVRAVAVVEADLW